MIACDLRRCPKVGEFKCCHALVWTIDYYVGNIKVSNLGCGLSGYPSCWQVGTSWCLVTSQTVYYRGGSHYNKLAACNFLDFNLSDILLTVWFWFHDNFILSKTQFIGLHLPDPSGFFVRGGKCNVPRAIANWEVVFAPNVFSLSWILMLCSTSCTG